MTDGILRKPRVVLSVNGASLTPIECSVHLSAHQSADTFDATVALDDPAGLDEHFWTSAPEIAASVLATNDVAGRGGWVTLISGKVDHPAIDWERRIVEASGRDQTAGLLDLKVNEKWLNRTSRDIITDLAGRAGLGVQFSGGSDKVGLEFKSDRNRISDLDSAWNVVVDLAREHGCIAFVKGSTLYVQPIDAATGATVAIHYQRPTPAMYASGNFITLRTSRDLNLAKDITFNHRSWRHEKGDAVESEFHARGSGTGRLSYRMRAANLQKDQQDLIAKSRLKQIISHERKMSVEIPGDISIDPRSMIALSGTGTNCDQTYLISDVTHQFSSEGFRTTINVRNSDSKRSIEQTK